MKNVRDIYFTLYKIDDKFGYIVLLTKTNGQDYMFYANNENEILERIKNENSKEVSEIYIPNKVSREIILKITEIMNVTIYISPQNNFKLKNVKYCYKFSENEISTKTSRSVIELSKYNNHFKECFDNLLYKYRSNEKIIEKLMNLEIIDFEKDKAIFLQYGKLIFDENNDICREVIVKDTSVHNLLYFTVEKKISGPLFKLINDTTSYLMDMIPSVQERISTHSKIFKLLDASIVEKIILYCICNNDFIKNETVEIELTQTSLNVLFLENDLTNIKRFFEYYTNKKISYDVLCKECKKKRIPIDIRKNGMKQVRLKIFLNKNIQEMDDDLDDLDFEIILFAKNNPNFTRKMIDQAFSISPRNSNIRIKKMIGKNILKASGNSKAICYNFNNDSK